MHITYKETEFAINIDTLINSAHPGPYLEIKSRTWSQRDATHKALLIDEMLRHLGINEETVIKHEYVEL
jgi:5-methylthioadenosine/S-adenosylhomocysteine deaminase